MKRLAVLLCLLTLTLVWIHPGDARADITVTDMAGRRVTIPKAAERIIGIAPGALRLIVYLQAQDKVVGVEDLEKKFPDVRPYWMAHPELGALPSIGTGGPNAINKKPDMEKILAVAPDVIFITYMDKALADTLQKEIGIPVVVLTYGPFASFDERVFESLRVAGKVLDREARADAVIGFIQKEEQALGQRTGDLPDEGKPSAYIGGLGFKGTHGIESTETAYAPFEWVKAKNIAGSSGQKGHLFADKETLLAWNPDFIFIDSANNQLVRQDYAKKREFYQGLKAFREGRAFGLHAFNWYVTNLGTVIVDSWAVGKILYPDRFADVDLAKKADEIYTFLVGKPVHGRMEAVYGALGQPLPYLE